MYQGNITCQAVAHDGDAELDEDEDKVNDAPNSAFCYQDGVAEPHVGMEFDSEDAAKAFYDEYARCISFSTKRVPCSHSKPGGTIVAHEFGCAREGLTRSTNQCDAMLRIELKDHVNWIVTKFVKEHSHSTLCTSKVHYLRPREHFAGTTEAVAETYDGTRTVPNGVMYVSMDGNHIPRETFHGVKNATPLELSNSLKNFESSNYTGRYSNRRTLGKDAQNLLDYFKKMQGENPGFFYAIQLDADNCMANAFWADGRSRAAYNHFGDAITLDTMYRVNHYKVPFVPFTGVNHHGQTVLFGCALLVDDSEVSFTWLFKTFLAAMNDRPPGSITTDQDRDIQKAVAHVFPRTRHCISRWHVLREGQERLAHVCHVYPNFQIELYNCINLTETVEEFESSWDLILDKYDLRKNGWLQNLYNGRRQWVPVYFRNSFFAVISPHQGFEGSFFDGYVNHQTTLPMFFRQYERAVEHSFDKEIEADLDTICTMPMLKTPSPMEKQAANLYTRKIFTKFQEELVETFVYTANRLEDDGSTSTFRVAKFENDHKAYVVTLSLPEMRASCSCQMFDYSGILCRHVLTVFTVTNVLTLPSHYVMKRWTRNAKSGVGSDYCSSDLHGQESLTMRYNNLCRESIKYAEDGAIFAETYKVAVAALREGAKKVSIMKKNVAKVAPPSSQVGGSDADDKKISGSDTTPLLWPRQDDEMIQHFNPNDAGVTDLNLPHMAPVSLHRDDGPSGNLAILPCLKSMTWVMENKNSSPSNRVAIINLKLQDYRKTPSSESEVKFQLSRLTLEPMLKSMAYISEQLSAPANRVAVINLKLQDTEATSGESEVKFQVSKDTLGAMLRSMAYIREQLSNAADPQPEPSFKRQRK